MSGRGLTTPRGTGERPPVTALADVEEAIATIAAGGVVIVVDDEDRENEGDLIVAAEFATADKVALFLEHTSGVICVALPGERLDELRLPLMVDHSRDSFSTAFTVSVDARQRITTGISAADRAVTIHALIDPATRPADLVRPGHVFPLRARPRGVLERPGHTEAAVDLARLAGLTPAGVLCEVVTPDRREMARLPELRRLAARRGLPIIAIADLVAYRRRREQLVRRVRTATMPTPWGEFTCHTYQSLPDGPVHLALVQGPVTTGDVLVRVHSECLTGDALGSLRCDCGEQLQASLAHIAALGKGVLVYLRGQEGRGIGLASKLAAYNLQDEGLDTVDANLALGLPVDAREYGVAAQILADLAVERVRLLTNNPAKYSGLAGYGVRLTERVPLEIHATDDNRRYLATKRARMGHLLEEEGEVAP